MILGKDVIGIFRFESRFSSNQASVQYSWRRACLMGSTFVFRVRTGVCMMSAVPCMTSAGCGWCWTRATWSGTPTRRWARPFWTSKQSDAGFCPVHKHTRTPNRTFRQNHEKCSPTTRRMLRPAERIRTRISNVAMWDYITAVNVNKVKFIPISCNNRAWGSHSHLHVICSILSYQNPNCLLLPCLRIMGNVVLWAEIWTRHHKMSFSGGMIRLLQCGTRPGGR